MTSQRPCKGLGDNLAVSSRGLAPDLERPASWIGTRSFVFFPDALSHNYDYLTQQRMAPIAKDSTESISTSYPLPTGELMLGGGFARGNAFLTELGQVDDREWHPQTGEYLTHALDNYFEIKDKRNLGERKERVKALWSGILGISADQKPWVGRIPTEVSGRREPQTPMISNVDKGLEEPSARLATPGEWIAAGYSGEGMVHAWMSGKALAYMVLGLDGHTAGYPSKRGAEENLEEWFPDVFRINEKRWHNTGIEDLVATFVLN